MRDESGVGHAFARTPTQEYEDSVVCRVNTGTVYSRRVRAVPLLVQGGGPCDVMRRVFFPHGRKDASKKLMYLSCSRCRPFVPF